MKKMKTIGQRMKFHREMVERLKSGEMAKVLGISGGSYSDLENDNAKPSADTLIHYCKDTTVDVHWLLTGKRKPEADIKIHWSLKEEEEEEEVEEIGALLLTQEDMVGNKQIDNDHKYLASLVNTIQAAVNSELGADVVLNHLAELYTYAKVHFKRDEEIQKNIKFKNRTKQKDMHKLLIDQLYSIHNELESAEEGVHQEARQAELFDDLVGWLFRHIEEDLKMRGCFE